MSRRLVPRDGSVGEKLPVSPIARLISLSPRSLALPERSLLRHHHRRPDLSPSPISPRSDTVTVVPLPSSCSHSSFALSPHPLSLSAKDALSLPPSTSASASSVLHCRHPCIISLFLYLCRPSPAPLCSLPPIPSPYLLKTLSLFASLRLHLRLCLRRPALSTSMRHLTISLSPALPTSRIADVPAPSRYFSVSRIADVSHCLIQSYSHSMLLPVFALHCLSIVVLVPFLGYIAG